MTKASCPFLVSHDAQHRQRTPVAYPSFENSCLGAEHGDSLLLTEQATFCLSGSYHYCARYQGLAADAWPADTPPGRTAPETFAEQQVAADFAQTGVAAQVEGQSSIAGSAADTWASAAWFAFPSTRWYSWVAAGLIFLAVVAVGAVFAAYTGWQLAVEQLASARSGPVNTLASAPVQQIQPLYVVMTATDEPATATSPAPLVVAPRSGLDEKPATAGGDYPAAVTATPVILVPLPTAAVTEGAAIPEANVQQQPPGAPANLQLPNADSTATPVPIIPVQLEVPPRRATPTFDIPTSTPEPEEPTATNTAVPIYGTPVIVFAPDERSVPPGECTHVRWHVENVRAVYYESLPAFGDGDKEECLDDEADSYALTVTFADGQTRIFTTTVDILWPTATPSLTPSFTPEILPTVTWTPVPPTPTATSSIFYGTTFAINGDNPYRCSPGSQCNIGVLATNTGNELDTLAIELVANGNWPIMICSQVGTCSSQRLVIANVGSNNTVFVTVQIQVPAESVGQATIYGLRSISEGSQGTITSPIVELTVESSE